MFTAVIANWIENWLRKTAECRGTRVYILICFIVSENRLSSVHYVPQAFANSRIATDTETCIAVVVVVIVVDRTFNDVKYSLKSVETQCIIRPRVPRLIMMNLRHKLPTTQSPEVSRSRNQIDSHYRPIFGTENNRDRKCS